VTNFVSPPGSNYVIEFTSNTTQNTGLLAESQQFNVTKSGGKNFPKSSLFFAMLSPSGQVPALARANGPGRASLPGQWAEVMG
jgi:hypothetical protein